MKAALYTRVSTDRQAEEGFSLEAQKDILMDVLERKNLQLYRIYSDPGISGGSFKRPGVQAMISDMKLKKFDTIIIHKLDRLSRNLGDLYNFIDMINRLDVRLIIAAQGSEEIDTRSPMGKAFLFFSGIWAQIYLENLREETLKGLIKKMKEGGMHISIPPLGYEFDPSTINDVSRKLVIIPEEAELIKAVFQKYLAGVGVTSIARQMNKVSTGKFGGKWDSKRIREIIKNPTYAGYNHFKPEHWPEDQRIIRNGDHPMIVSKEDFARVQSHIKRRGDGQMSKRSFNYPYSGIIKCHRCGGNYAGNASVQNGVTYKNYRCYNNYVHKTCDSPSISEKNLNKLIFGRILMVDDDIQPTKIDKKEKKNIQKEVEISNKRRKNWMLALGDGKLSPDDYAMLIDEEDERMNNIYKNIQEEELYEPEISTGELKEMILNISDSWDLVEDGTQKQFIQSMFRKIEVEHKEDGWDIIDILTV